jgi:hypothetical protein
MSESLELESGVDANFSQEATKIMNQITDTTGKVAGYVSGYVSRLVKDSKEAVAKIDFSKLPNLPQMPDLSHLSLPFSLPKWNWFGGPRGVDFITLFRRENRDFGPADNENPREFYESLGREIVEMSKQASSNENLTIISAAKFK